MFVSRVNSRKTGFPCLPGNSYGLGATRSQNDRIFEPIVILNGQFLSSKKRQFHRRLHHNRQTLTSFFIFFTSLILPIQPSLPRVTNPNVAGGPFRPDAMDVWIFVVAEIRGRMCDRSHNGDS
jgi:hypothetical protein